jgi:hypothetical protein
MKEIKKARVIYNAEMDAFDVQFNVGEGWVTDTSYHCVARDGKPGVTEFIHWSIFQKLTDMAYMGYKIDFMSCGGAL